MELRWECFQPARGLLARTLDEFNYKQMGLDNHKPCDASDCMNCVNNMSYI